MARCRCGRRRDAAPCARQQDVNALWAGLGYYRRARMLRDGAAKVVEAHRGELPSDIAALKSIPGIGDYTAGAYAGMAVCTVKSGCGCVAVCGCGCVAVWLRAEVCDCVWLCVVV